MAEQGQPKSFDVVEGEPLIGVPLNENGRQIVRYFTDEAAADEALAGRRRQRALDLAGVWSDLDWEAAADELDRIRHESRPTPPIDLDL